MAKIIVEKDKIIEFYIMRDYDYVAHAAFF